MATISIKVFATSSLRRSSILRAMGKGAQRVGLDCEIVEELRYADCDVAVVWGLPKSDFGNSSRAKERQRFRHDLFARHTGTVVVVEAPVVGRRVKPRGQRPWLFQKLFPNESPWTQFLLPKSRSTLDPFSHYRIGLGGFPDEGGLALAPFCKGRWAELSRRLALPEIRPYRKDGRHIMVIGQVSGDASLRGEDINQWVMDTATDLRRITDRPILVRPHPLARDFLTSGLPERLDGIGVKVDDLRRPFEESLKGAWSVVTFSSGAAVDALLAGIPVTAMSTASFAREVTGHALDSALDPTLFDRMPWLDKLAAAHWCEGEIANGDVWEPLLKAINAAYTEAAVAA
jgi:hypothetical protein